MPLPLASVCLVLLTSCWLTGIAAALYRLVKVYFITHPRRLHPILKTTIHCQCSVSAAAATQYAAFASYVVADWQQPQHPASMNQEAVASAVPAMKLQITQVFGPGGAMSLKAVLCKACVMVD